MANAIRATVDQVVEAINQIRTGAVMVAATFRTTPKMNKGGRGDTPRNPYHGSVEKMTRCTFIVQHDWDNAVSRDAAKQGDEVVERVTEREAWHEPVRDADGKLTAFSRHKGDHSKLYWRVARLRGATLDASAAAAIGAPAVMVGEVTTCYVSTVDGSTIDRHDLEPWLPSRRPYVARYVNQDGEEKNVEATQQFLLYGLDTLQEITVNGVQYLVEQ